MAASRVRPCSIGPTGPTCLFQRLFFHSLFLTWLAWLAWSPIEGIGRVFTSPVTDQKSRVRLRFNDGDKECEDVHRKKTRHMRGDEGDEGDEGVREMVSE